MTSRERVFAALNHEESDRVPVALGGGPYGLVDELYFKMLELLDLGEPVDPFRTGHNITFQDDRLFERLGTDTRYIWPGLSPSSPTQQTGDPEVCLDGFGQSWRRAFPYYYAERGILVDAAEMSEIEERVMWPDTNDPKFVEGVGTRAKELRKKTDAFVIARMVTSHGPFQLACSLRGTEQYMMDMAMAPDFAHRLIERIGETIAGLNRAYLEAAGDNVDMIELPGDDYASNNGPLISPAMFREFIKPVVGRVIDEIRSVRPDIKIMLHSDGNITRLIPEIIDLGADVLHPLEPIPGLDHKAIKEEFGQSLAFLGAIDISHAMPGTKEQVVEEAKTRIEALAPGGGYILAPSNHLQADVPPENVVTLYETAREYGECGSV